MVRERGPRPLGSWVQGPGVGRRAGLGVLAPVVLAALAPRLRAVALGAKFGH